MLVSGGQQLQVTDSSFLFFFFETNRIQYTGDDVQFQGVFSSH